MDISRSSNCATCLLVHLEASKKTETSLHNHAHLVVHNFVVCFRTIKGAKCSYYICGGNRQSFTEVATASHLDLGVQSKQNMMFTVNHIAHYELNHVL